MTVFTRWGGGAQDPGSFPATSWTDDSWDAFVRASARPSYLQTRAWAEVKSSTGWSTLIVGDEAGARGDNQAFGARLLTRPIPLTRWRFAYAPRGPIVTTWDPRAALEWTSVLRIAAIGAGPLARTAVVRMDPEIEAGSRLESPIEGSQEPFSIAVEELLAAAGWRRAHDMQPRRTRIIDLAEDEDVLWSGLRGKWRQYVNKARRGGVVVREVDPAAEPGAFDTFHGVMRDVARRTALPLRSAGAFRDIWAAFASPGESRLLFADGPGGETQAVLLLIRCGSRVTEPYGGMTAAGAESRANYLLKWEAIRSSREQGATAYDLWGLIGTGIDYFKEGFGGREVTYVGAWDLPLSRVGAPVFHAGERGRSWYRAARRLLRGERLALPAAPGSDG